MVNSILETTRLEAESSKVDKAEVSLERLFSDLRTSCAVLVDEKITLKWDHPADLPVIITDRLKVYRILSNVIENAIKFTAEGSVVVSTEIHWNTHTLEVKVTDTGVGIGENDLVSIFEMFHQVDSSDTRKYAGVGLGLYIAKKFTDLLGGIIEVESVLGKGSMFTIRLPFETDSSPIIETSGNVAKEFTILR